MEPARHVSTLPDTPASDGSEPCGICGGPTGVEWRRKRTMSDPLGTIPVPPIVHVACYYTQPPHPSTKDRWPWKK